MARIHSRVRDVEFAYFYVLQLLLHWWCVCNCVSIFHSREPVACLIDLVCEVEIETMGFVIMIVGPDFLLDWFALQWKAPVVRLDNRVCDIEKMEFVIIIGPW